MAMPLLEPVFRAVAQSRTNEIAINSAQMTDWPAGLREALCSHGILHAAPDAECTICPGCVRACVMPVVSLEFTGRQDPAYLIVCNKPENYGIIEIGWRAVD
jgi:hypothetical protein